MLMAIDNAVWGDFWAGYHIHTLIWHTLFLVAGVLCINAMAHKESVVRLATWIFCLENAHFVTASWWSNRHALVTGTFALICLWLHLRGKRSLSVVFYILALLSGEFALAIVGFLIALVIFPRSNRLAEAQRSWPHIIISLIYAGVYVVFERGVSGSAFYLDPVHATGEYLQALPQRWLMLFGEMFHQLPSDVAFVGMGPFLAAIGLLVLVLVLWRGRRPLDWVLLGASLSLLPAIGAPAAGRMLLLASVGSAVWLASYILELREYRPITSRLFLGWTLTVPPILGLAMLFSMKQVGIKSEGSAQDALTHCPGSEEVWILNPPDHIVGFYLPILQEQALKHQRQRIRALTMGNRPVEYRLLDGRLELRSEELFFDAQLELFWNLAPEPEFSVPNSFQISVSDHSLWASSPHFGTADSPCLLQWKESSLQPVAIMESWQFIGQSPSPSGL